MANKRTFKTKHSDIFEYYKDKCITETGDIEIEIGYNGYDSSKVNTNNSIPIIVDWGEPCCFACGGWTGVSVEKSDDDLSKLWNSPVVKHCLERAHIVPDALGGDDTPKNLFCLCKRCHRDSPDTIYPKEFFIWCYHRRKGGTLRTRTFLSAIEICKNRGINPSFIIASETFENPDPPLNSHGAIVTEASYVASLVGGAAKRQEALENCLTLFTGHKPNDEQIINAINGLRYVGFAI